MSSIKVKAKLDGDTAIVKALISHPMHTGQQKDKKTGELIPAHFIQEVKCEHGGKTVLTALWGAAVSKNPYLSFKFKGAKDGDKIKLSWVDNKGNSDSTEAPIQSPKKG
jgi:sulfur-oxidizing protein SoxZ